MASSIELIFVGDVPEKFDCSICTNILTEPVLTECCGQHFCKRCLEAWLKKEKKESCPHCRKIDFKYIKSLPIQREINSLNIYCHNRNHGCDKPFPCGTLEEHLAICGFVEVLCTNDCGATLFRKDLEQHRQQRCPQRKVQCKLCGVTGAYKNITTNHQTICPDMLVTCPLQCGALRIKRKNLQSHKHKCPLESVQCPFFEAGCKEDIPRKDLDAHIASTSSLQSHLQLVMTTSAINYAKLKAEHDNLRLQHEELRKEFDKMAAVARGFNQAEEDKEVYTEEEEDKVVYTEEEEDKVVYTEEEEDKVVYTEEEEDKVVYTEEEEDKVVYTEEEEDKVVYTEEEDNEVYTEEEEDNEVYTEEEEEEEEEDEVYGHYWEDDEVHVYRPYLDDQYDDLNNDDWDSG